MANNSNTSNSSNSSTTSNSRFKTEYRTLNESDDGFNTLVAMSVAKDLAITALAGAACYKLLSKSE